MKVGLTAHELRSLREAPCEYENVRKICAFCLGTAILHELHRTVADGAIRDPQNHGEYAPYVAATSGDDRGETRLALTQPRGRVPRITKSGSTRQALRLDGAFFRPAIRRRRALARRRV